jgi:hypothetical protein
MAHLGAAYQQTDQSDAREEKDISNPSRSWE